MMWARWTLGVSLLLAACEFTTCPAVACSTGATLRIHSNTGMWSPGAYTATGSLDGSAYSCTFTVPSGSPDLNARLWADCGTNAPLSMVLTTDQSCQYREQDDELLELCTAIPGSFMLELTPRPEALVFDVNVARDGTVVVDQSGSFTYRNYGSESCGYCPRGDADLTATM